MQWESGRTGHTLLHAVRESNAKADHIMRPSKRLPTLDNLRNFFRGFILGEAPALDFGAYS